MGCAGMSTQTPALRMKTQRNDPCPCGSGKKYKKCCGQTGVEPLSERASPQAVDQPRPRPQPVSGVEIRELVGLFNAGRYVELEAQARKLTARDPTSGIAWKVLGAA